MSTLSKEFKKKFAEIYSKNRAELENLDPIVMESFSSEIIELIENEKTKSEALHDLELLGYNMGLLKNYSSALKNFSPETDEYDFTKNDCKNLVDSTKKWLILEKLI